MKRFSEVLLTLALASVSAGVLTAQDAYVAAAGGSGYTQDQAAPIERQTPQDAPPPNAGPRGYRHGPMRPHIVNSQPVHGVMVRTERHDAMQTVSSDATRTELRLAHGIANVMVHDPAHDMLLLVDLPGGQVQLLKNGFYTFNADTNTVRVFSGEADAFVANADKPLKVKGDYQVVFAGGQARVSYADPYYARQDVLPGGEGGPQGEPGYGGGYGYPVPVYGYAGYGYGPYWEGYYGYPYGYYDAWDYPYWGGPLGWGGWGLGFGWGWGGGFYGGRGGYSYGYGGRGFPGHGGGYPGGGIPHPGGSFGGGGGHAAGGGGHR